jgi:PAS domain S-box-containing protein
LFFSTTDLKGRIGRANSVFQRIAGYSWDQLANKPHNIIRHPEMPRIVFQLLWDYIQDGRPIVAFVKNLAHDGRYYWVVALVVPIPDGYLSVRFKPTSQLLATVELLYGELKAVEAVIESDSNDRKAAIGASRGALTTKLRTLGFSSYDDFMQHALKSEMQSREQYLREFCPPAAVLSGANHNAELDSLESAAEMFDGLVEVLNVMFADLEAYVHINTGVRAKSMIVTDRADSLRVSALNGVIAVDKLGTKATGLRPVLDTLRALSGEITNEGIRLCASLDELIKDLDLAVFNLSAAKLQIEMTARFAHELVDHASVGRLNHSTASMTEGAIGSLHASSCETVRKTLSGLASIKERLKTLTESQARLIGSSHFLRPIYLTGKIEMAEGSGTRLATVFEQVGDQLKEIGTSLSDLKILLEDLGAHLVRGLAHGEQIEAAIAQIDSHMNTARLPEAETSIAALVPVA